MLPPSYRLLLVLLMALLKELVLLFLNGFTRESLPSFTLLSFTTPLIITTFWLLIRLLCYLRETTHSLLMFFVITALVRVIMFLAIKLFWLRWAMLLTCHLLLERSLFYDYREDRWAWVLFSCQCLLAFMLAFMLAFLGQLESLLWLDELALDALQLFQMVLPPSRCAR